MGSWFPHLCKNGKGLDKGGLQVLGDVRLAALRVCDRQAQEPGEEELDLPSCRGRRVRAVGRVHRPVCAVERPEAAGGSKGVRLVGVSAAELVPGALVDDTVAATPLTPPAVLWQRKVDGSGSMKGVRKRVCTSSGPPSWPLWSWWGP